MKKFFKTKEIALCGLLTSIMFIMGFAVVSIANLTGKSIFQLSDIVYLSLFSIINPITLMTSSCLSAIFIDLYGGGFIFIPLSIVVKILIGITFLSIRKILNKYFAVFISYLWIALYILYAYLIFDAAAAWAEFIIDCIQYGATTLFAVIFLATYDLRKIKPQDINTTNTLDQSNILAPTSDDGPNDLNDKIIINEKNET